MKRNTDNLMCEYADGVVPYLYDEMPPREMSIFESHLEHCTACTDEFAAVADARFSVYEWHKEAFVPLETPRFIIPDEPVTVGIWAQFAGMFGAARPGFAFAVGMAALIGAVVVGYNVMGPSEQQLASNTDVPDPRPAVTAVAPLTGEMPDPVEVPNEPRPFRTSSVRTAKPAAKRSSDMKPPARPVKAVPENSLRQAKAPALNDDIEVEDESLRLTDLFDEVGG